MQKKHIKKCETKTKRKNTKKGSNVDTKTRKSKKP